VEPIFSSCKQADERGADELKRHLQRLQQVPNPSKSPASTDHHRSFSWQVCMRFMSYTKKHHISYSYHLDVSLGHWALATSLNPQKKHGRFFPKDWFVNP